MQYIIPQANFKLRIPSGMSLTKARLNKNVYIFNESDFNKLLIFNKLSNNNYTFEEPYSGPMNLSQYKNSYKFVSFIDKTIITLDKATIQANEIVKSVFSKQIGNKGKIVKDIKVVDLTIRDLNSKKSKLQDELKWCRDSSDLVEQVKKILSLKDIIGFKVEGNILRLFTDTILVNDGHSTWDIGKLIIQLNPNASNHLIRFYHSSDPEGEKDKYPTPHVDEAGGPCFGNISSTVTRLLTTKDYYNLIIISLMFLKSYEDDDKNYPYAELCARNSGL